MGSKVWITTRVSIKTLIAPNFEKVIGVISEIEKKNVIHFFHGGVFFPIRIAIVVVVRDINDYIIKIKKNGLLLIKANTSQLI